MAISNLTGQKTYKSFKDLLQVSSSGILYDGLGTPVTYLDITASYTLGVSSNENIFTQTGSYWNASKNIGITGSFQLALNGIDQYFSIAVAGEEKIKVNTEGVLQLMPQNITPYAIRGGIFYSGSDAFYLGFDS